MNIAMAQINFQIGDIAGNTAKILDTISWMEGADLIVFSELAITGYYPKDLLYRESLLEQQDKALARIVEATKEWGASVLIGLVERNPSAGKPFRNAAYLIDNGTIVYRYTKQLLPTYGVFDEARHFQPGSEPGIVEWRGQKLGILICEDAWESDDKPLYQHDPVKALAEHAVDLVISINASPCSLGKPMQRFNVIQRVAKTIKAPVIYVNQVGANDDLVFDGRSMAVGADGSLLANPATGGIYLAESYQECVLPVSLPGTTATASAEELFGDDISLIANQLRMGLSDYCAKTGFSKVAIGSSGGIDSAVCIALAAWALGPENVTAVTMPTDWSSKGSVSDSAALCEALGVKLFHSPIGESLATEVAAYESTFGGKPGPIAHENLQARIRGQRLMTYSNTTGAMIVSTGNKSELSVGYCTLYGDMAGGLSLLGDLYKLQVYALAKYLNQVVFEKTAIPEAIITKAPSAELSPGQVDSDALPPYEQLDAILRLYLEDELISDADKETLMAEANKAPAEVRTHIQTLVDRNEYKRKQAPPVIKVTQRAFGADRQIPITSKVV